MKRKTARKLLIRDIHASTYIKRPGWDPSGILTSFGEVARVNVMGTVVSLSQEDNTFIVDDGSGNISVRFFEDTKIDFPLGSMVTVIGRPREWESTKYIVPEIVKKVDDEKWYKSHLLEIKLNKREKKIKLPVEDDQQEVPVDAGPYQKILNVIAIMDGGSGADVQEIVNHIKMDGCEDIINNLIEEGEIFEISPGRVKILE